MKKLMKRSVEQFNAVETFKKSKCSCSCSCWVKISKGATSNNTKNLNDMMRNR